ncbi:unnamed protein product [Lymnaea stagnalis]|uniref:Uncharacterized protein n=1 Tax=Lymnaea stagnalis TaxID=6523 RepID=A0AAV2H2F5_LYMST
MALPQTSFLSRFTLCLACIAFVLYVIGFAAPNWLEQEFELPPQPPALPRPLPVKANMGLYAACQEVTYTTPNGTKVVEDCSSDGAAQWQFIAVGLAIVGMVTCLTALVLACLYHFNIKVNRKCCIRHFIAFFNFTSSGGMTAALIMYACNRKFQVKPPLPYQYDFDLDWAYYVSTASAALLGIITLFNVIDIIWTKKCYESAASEDPEVAENKKRKNVNGISKSSS